MRDDILNKPSPTIVVPPGLTPRKLSGNTWREEV